MGNENTVGGKDTKGHGSVQAWSHGDIFPYVIERVVTYSGQDGHELISGWRAFKGDRSLHPIHASYDCALAYARVNLGLDGNNHPVEFQADDFYPVLNDSEGHSPPTSFEIDEAPEATLRVNDADYIQPRANTDAFDFTRLGKDLFALTDKEADTLVLGLSHADLKTDLLGLRGDENPLTQWQLWRSQYPDFDKRIKWARSWIIGRWEAKGTDALENWIEWAEYLSQEDQLSDNYAEAVASMFACVTARFGYSLSLVAIVEALLAL